MSAGYALIVAEPLVWAQTDCARCGGVGLTRPPFWRARFLVGLKVEARPCFQCIGNWVDAGMPRPGVSIVAIEEMIDG